ncbi:DUF3488 and DUF4129 domain-containing transglutaminase family protein [Sporolactobacillus shoreicorticis]|uniref:TransglutaminaseTgpA domain-containing protein n=1 Tax=Sporolactobacillus shoreicorticis TaxID=1923877 RepID=A0ABW5S7J1_9BACL|nr:transglutaminaseTgpA domain-containing protein [Sporolactobacillus shoreicorticis]MCO7128066.1 DUF3488 and DUF4129 domain-containing transglutaminase family protein [Sporolactobacillus shoreicorticis]
MSERLFTKLTNAVIYGLAGFLVWLCAKPLIELTILNSRPLLIFFITVMMLMFYLKLPGWLCSSVCVLMILHAVHFYFFYNEPLLSFDWLVQLSADIGDNLSRIWQGEMGQMTDLFSAFMFYILFGMITFALRYWLRKEQLIFLIALAIVCSVLIDTMTVYHGATSIVAMVATALFMLSIQKWQLFSLKYPEGKKLKSGLPWFAVSGFAIAILLIVGLLMPKPGSQWTAPSNYLNGLGFTFFQNGSFFSGNQRIGYDEDDTRLGGSIGMDQTPLFTAAVSGNPGYWRVAHKDHYTGRGWSDGERYFLPASDRNAFSTMLSLYEAQTKTINQTAVLRFERSSPAILPYTGEPKWVEVPGKRLKVDQLTSQLQTIDEKKASSEILDYAAPVYQTEKLRQTTESDPEEIRSRYLQVPQDLPDRVRALGRRLTAGHSNRYDQVKAVVNYLRSSRFKYSTDNIPRPSRNQDYVDQFLFESKVGYCDNFSTSMVILLRSAGIPARWVKGFTSGEYQEQLQEKINGKTVDLKQYQITNADAHSWGEVYFPGSGWVTFEPTPSFSDPSQFVANSSNNRSSQSNSDQSSGNSETAENQQDASSQKDSESSRQAKDRTDQQTESVQKKRHSAKATPGPGIHWQYVGWTAMSVLLIGIIVAWLTRKKWLRAVYIRRIQNNPLGSSQDFQKIYRLLLLVLRFDGMKRSESETLREYAKRVGTAAGEELFWLTERYEQMIYSNNHQLTLSDSEHIRSLLDRWINSQRSKIKRVKE